MKTITELKASLDGKRIEDCFATRLPVKVTDESGNIFLVKKKVHEDGQDTWRYGWSEDDYKEEGWVRIFESTDYIIKKKPSPRFKKAHTYTAEKCMFIFLEPIN